MATYSSRSLNQIVNEFKTIADNHRFINSFACGTMEDFATSGDTRYPAMWMKHESVTVNRKTQDITFSILIIDRVKKDRTNLQEVLSDTLRTLSDIRTQIEQPAYGWEISFGSSTPVYEDYMEDEIAGWESTFTITQPFINDVCAIPFIVPPTPTNGWTGGSGSTTWPDYVPTSRTLTINGTSYDLSADRSWTISASGATWGAITGTLSDQTDLQTALNAKQNAITTGTSAQYFRGDLSLATFPTNVSSFTNDAAYITSSSLTAYVPYTGATGDVNIGTHTFRSQLLYVNASSVNDPLGNVTAWTSEQDSYRTQHFSNIFWFTEFGGVAPVQTLHAITSQTSMSMGTYSNHPVKIRVNNSDGWTFGTNGYMRYNNNTASRFAIFDSNKDLISADTTTYPSLTELSYVKGVSSAIQTQLDNKILTISCESGTLSPADSTTYYMGLMRLTPNTTATNYIFKIGYDCTLVGAIISIGGNTTAGTSELSTMYLRNVTTSTSSTIGTFRMDGSSTIIRNVTHTGLNISIGATDDIALEFTTAVFATNPVGALIFVQLILKR